MILAQTDLSTWSQILSDRGLAVFILLALGIATWRVLVFFAPLVTRLFEKFISLLENLSHQITEQTSAMRSAVETLQKQGHQIEEIHRSVVRDEK